MSQSATAQGDRDMSKKKQEVQGMLSVETITQSILLLRGHKVILDYILADLYGVETRAYSGG